MAIPNGPIRILELRCAEGAGGGPEKTIREHARLADRSRYEISVCYVHVDDGSPFDIVRKAAEAGLDFVSIAQNHGFDRSVFRRVAEVVVNRQIQIVHAHDYKSDLIALWLARKLRVIPLSTAHGFTGHSVRERWVYYPLDRMLLKWFPRVIAVSGELRDTLARAGVCPSRITVIPNGIDSERIRRQPMKTAAARAALGFDADDLVVGSVGRLEPQKRFDLLISAAAGLCSTFSRLRLVIAGDGGERASLQRQVERLGLSKRVRLLGHVADIGTFYHALDLFVQSSDYEGTPNVVLEAMAYEVPVVATHVGGTAELVRDGVDALLVRPGSPNLLAAAISKAAEDPSATASRVVAARSRVESDLSFRQRMRKVEAVYEEVWTGRFRDCHQGELAGAASANRA